MTRSLEGTHARSERTTLEFLIEFYEKTLLPLMRYSLLIHRVLRYVYVVGLNKVGIYKVVIRSNLNSRFSNPERHKVNDLTSTTSTSLKHLAPLGLSSPLLVSMVKLKSKKYFIYILFISSSLLILILLFLFSSPKPLKLRITTREKKNDFCKIG